MNAAILEQLEQGNKAWPVLRIDWQRRGNALRTDYFAPGGYVTPGVPVRSKTESGGWGSITYGPGVRGSTLGTVRTSVKVEDSEQSLAALLETYNPRDSAARIYLAAAGLVESDWDTKFVGIVEDWRSRAGVVEIILKTDEAALRAPRPRAQFTRSAWPSAPDPSIFGTTIPLVLGIHDSFRITVRGQVRAYSLRRDDTAPTTLQLYSGSLGNLTEIHRVYYDGELQTGLAFQTLRGLYGGIYQTLIGIPRDDAPEPEVVVSFDATGPDVDGGTTGSTLTNPIAQLRTYLQEYVFRENNDGIYVGAHPLIHQASWSDVEAFFESRGAECGIVIAGQGSRPSGLDVVESYLNALKMVRLWWNEDGQIVCRLIPYEDSDPPGSAWVVADRDAEPGSFVFEPGDRKEVFNRVEMPYLFSDAEGRFLAQHEAHDVDSIDDPLADPVSNPWSQARYDQSTV